MDTPPSPPSSSGKEQEGEEDEDRSVEYSVSDSPTPSSPEIDEDVSGDDEVNYAFVSNKQSNPKPYI